MMNKAARWSRRAAIAALAIVGLAHATGAASVVPVDGVLVAAGIVAGLPHGALDHAIAAPLYGRSVKTVAAVYAATALAAWAALEFIGTPAIVAVLLLSLVHFGAGEVETARAIHLPLRRRGHAWAVGIAGTGALVLPLVRGGDDIRSVAASLDPSLADLLESPLVRIGAGSVWLVAAIAALVIAVRQHAPGLAADVLVVAALGALAPPLVAFAIWFGGWHSLRHMARLVTVRPDSSLRDAIAPTAAALVFLAVLALVVNSAPDPTSALGSALLVLLALTTPHMVVVMALDRSDRAPVNRLRAMQH